MDFAKSCGSVNRKPTDDRPWELSNSTHNLFDIRLRHNYNSTYDCKTLLSRERVSREMNAAVKLSGIRKRRICSKRLRHPYRPEIARPRRRDYDNDLHARVEQRRTRSEKPTGSLMCAMPVNGISCAKKSRVNGRKRQRSKHLGESFSPG